MANSETPPPPVALEDRGRDGVGRQFSPSAARNSGPIREVLERVLPKSGIALEIGSGTGEHVICFARALPGLLWQPSDPDPAARASIEAWIAAEGLANVRAPVAIDTRHALWGVEDDAPYAAMISLNMIHIAPWKSALGLLAGAGRLLRPDGRLYLYGPFMRGGAHTAPSNAAFDADLKRRDPRWGVRDIDNLIREAAPHGLDLREIIDMPAKNLSLVFVKSGPAL
jgi:SAM-dependent methyltransferase